MPTPTSKRPSRRTALGKEALHDQSREPGREGGLAVKLLELARDQGPSGLLYISGGEHRIEALAPLLWALAPNVETLLLPPWDCPPYDRTSPSGRVMGLRIATLSRLTERQARPWLVLATAEALLQRLPPRPAWSGRTLRIAVGDAVDPKRLADDLAAIGYNPDDRIDETGEFAIRGAVIDVFPAGYYLPVRIDHAEGRVTAIASFDAATQRKSDSFEHVRLQPVSEAILPVGEAEQAASRDPGLEHRLPDLYGRLETILDYAPDARIIVGSQAAHRGEAFAEQVRDAYESRLKFDRGGIRPLAPEALYLDPQERDRSLATRRVTTLVAQDEEDEREVPVFSRDDSPTRALRQFVAVAREAGKRILIAGPAGADLDALVRRAAEQGGPDVQPAASWDEVAQAAPGSLLSMALPLAAGFRADPDVVAIAAADVLGSRAGLHPARAADAGIFDGEDGGFRSGDAVVHLAHGVGLLRGLDSIDTGTVASAGETIRLEYQDGDVLMVPTGDLDLMWRYGPMREGVSLDRLGGTSWPKRRAKVEAEIGQAAADLARLATAHRTRKAVRLVPPRRDYERFAAGFPFAETADQSAAVSDVLRDLASGHAMDRLVCGDVGFGKTEVALRAAAAALLAGRQVAVAAPTTVLVRQHLDVFRRRFADLGVEIGHLSRLVSAAEVRDVKAGLKDGRVRLVIGTQALAGRGVAFADLGLLIVDEEQRFGAADKEKLRRLGRNVHVLTLTATPIPRTMQAALVGLREVSVLSTPPAERQPVRTVVGGLDEPVLRDALLREHRRGGQSFVVCPRIEDIEPMRGRLGRLVPELSLRVAHGKLKAAAIDETMVAFADGVGDVLLATNIIESGLDVPRANTVAVWRAERFGLGQLHQLRGRVGRGRLRGTAYLVTDPDETLSADARNRLDRLAALDRLGAGFAISAEDLDSRGGGDLLGDEQSGHVRLIGASLYRRLLERALMIARGELPPDEWTPELNVGVSGRIPVSYVPEPDVRLNLYARIARARDAAEEARLTEEIADRFGPVPREVDTLVALAGIRRLARTAGVARIDAGPQGVALTFKEGKPGAAALTALGNLTREAPAWKERRLILHPKDGAADVLGLVQEVLQILAE